MTITIVYFDTRAEAREFQSAMRSSGVNARIKPIARGWTVELMEN